MPFALSSALALTLTLTLASRVSAFRLDVHSHVVPDFYRQALIDAGYEVRNGTVFADGFPLPDWDLSAHISSMDTNRVNYSTLSVSSPGVSFLVDDSTAASALARKLNEAIYNYTQQYPSRLGGLCVLPLPDVDAAVDEIKYCLDTLAFDGVGMYTNVNGTYLGNAKLDPVFDELNRRNATVFVHPSSPSCRGSELDYPDPTVEFPFDSVRAMENMFFTGQRANYSGVSIIFPHGGGAMPYLATRIAGMASLSFMGGYAVADTLAQFKGYFFDTASATSAAQLYAMKEFFGDVSKIVTGTDYPFVSQAQALSAISAIQSNGDFTDAEMDAIKSENALGIFPGVASKLRLS